MRISDWSSDVCSSDLILLGLGNVRTAPRIAESNVEPSRAQMEHMQRAENLKLIACVAVFLGDGQASIQGHPCGIHSSARAPQGHANSCLKVHLFASAARRNIELLNRPTPPTAEIPD